jgi:hypothetical protein
VHAETVFDLTAALEHIDGDRDLFIVLADIFIRQSRVDMAAIRAWLIQGTAMMLPDAKGLRLRATLVELAVNAVEHGSLEIFYQEKQEPWRMIAMNTSSWRAARSAFRSAQGERPGILRQEHAHHTIPGDG